jgi:hypothetical protein
MLFTLPRLQFHSFVMATVSNLIPGPIVLESVALFKYRPLQEAGLVLTTDSKIT